MITINILKCIFLLLGGLGVFMFGMKYLSTSLTENSASKMKSLMTKVTDKAINGIFTGAAVTASIQSSSATTVMVVGFVNAGMMTLLQATYMILGANIGTTLTGFIISLESLPITHFLTIMTLIGFVGKTARKKEKPLIIFDILIGLGMIFMGLYTMSNSMKGFADTPQIKELFLMTTNPAILFIISMLATGLIQSSSAGTGIVMSFASGGLMNLESALYCILGMNVGTCVTALLASAGTSLNGKRAAIIHLMFNLIGGAEFFVLLLIPQTKNLIFALFPKESITVSIAVFNFAFNLISTLTVAPFAKQFVRFVEIISSGKRQRKKT